MRKLLPNVIIAVVLCFSCTSKDDVAGNLPVAEKGFTDCTSPDDVKVSTDFGAPYTLPSSYQVDTGLLTRTNDFYDPVTNWPINQNIFGICETCSTVGLLSYSIYHNTNTISPMFTLLRAYNYPIKDSTGTPQQFYLWGDPSLPKLWAFYEQTGFVRYSGIPENSDSVFIQLAQNLPLNANSHPDYTKLPSQTPTPNPWQIQFNKYGNDTLTSVVGTNDNVTKLILSGNATIFSGNGVPQKIASAIDKGYLVLIMFRYLYQWDGVKGDATYLFDRFTYSLGQLTHSDTHDSTMYNTWLPPVRSYYVGETHWVYLFSYASGGNDTIFFVRNSWGAKRGENGNYYMTASYLTGQYNDPITKKPSNILKYYYGYKP
ncbi:MAG: hypothetical protein ACOYNU_13010 [Bacteroidales bacterium]|jgi:hypothetical protein